MTNNLNFSNGTYSTANPPISATDRNDAPLYKEWLRVSGDVDDFIFFDDCKSVSDK